jgi:hypothetical protein
LIRTHREEWLRAQAALEGSDPRRENEEGL